MPTTSLVSHGRDASSGPIAISYRRSVSAPYCSYMSSGETAFFRLLPILPYSRVTGLPSYVKPVPSSPSIFVAST